MRQAALVCLALLVAPLAHATDVRVANVSATRAATLSVTAQVSWKNGWRNERNHDAVWLFVKLRARSERNWRHGKLIAAAAPCKVAADRVGAFCAPSAAHRGDVNLNVTLDVESTELPEGEIEARLFAIEMVYIPSGPFFIGDRDARSAEQAAFYRSDATGNHAGLYRIDSESEIRVAGAEGAMYYQSRNEYQGDRQGPIPAAFPKGTRAFYVMKYELLQGEYAEFLNMIPRDYTFFRAPIGGLGYAQQRGTIRVDGERYVAGQPHRPANWVSWDDGIAFADWAGLRPMTELEFTKAARGPVEPVPGDYPWGTDSKERLLRRVGPDDELAQSGPADESLLTDATKDVLGASYYWVMDLAGSVWERVVSVGHPSGRAFRGTHGNGVLKSYGLATNDDWPAGDHEGGGYGYRGGGYYERGMKERELNPFSRVSWRPYGAWGGAPRSIAYGFRAVRTAD